MNKIIEKKTKKYLSHHEAYIVPVLVYILNKIKLRKTN